MATVSSSVARPKVRGTPDRVLVVGCAHRCRWLRHPQLDWPRPTELKAPAAVRTAARQADQSHTTPRSHRTPASRDRTSNVLHRYHTQQQTDPDLIELNIHTVRHAPLPRFMEYAAVLVAGTTWKGSFYAPSANSTLDPGYRSRKRPEHFAITTFKDLLDSFFVVASNHAGDDIPRFASHYTSKDQLYLSQICASAHYKCGHNLVDDLQIWLNYHIYPNIPMVRYREVQLKVKALREKSGAPYT